MTKTYLFIGMGVDSGLPDFRVPGEF